MSRFRNIISIFVEKYDDIDLQQRITDSEDSKILKDIFRQVATQGFKANNAKIIADKIENDHDFPGWDARALCTAKAKGLMLKYLNNEKKINKIVKQYKHIAASSIPKWFEDLRSGTISMGLKSDDDFLKDHGFFDRIPIDRFYPPFLARTGILYEFINQQHIDPGKYFGSLGDSKTYNAYRDLIISECKNNLHGIAVDGLALSVNPGIVDLYIWRHCANSGNAKNICGSSPKCKSCIISRYCNYGCRS